MTIVQEFQLQRDCPATLIPAGDVVKLAAGTLVEVAQALGSGITIRTPEGLFQILRQDVDALGADAVDALSLDSQESIASELQGPFSEGHVWAALKQCFDPEIPINIVDLGLIYDLRIELVAEEQYRVQVAMTLTAQGCGMGPSIAADAKNKIECLPAVCEASVQIVWDPVWSPHMISAEGRRQLDLD